MYLDIDIKGVEAKDDKILFEFTPETEKEIVYNMLIDYFENDCETLKILEQIEKGKLGEILIDFISSQEIDYLISHLSDENKFKFVERFVSNSKDFLKEKIAKTDVLDLENSSLTKIEKISDILGLGENEKKRLVADRFLSLLKSYRYDGKDEELVLNELSQISQKYKDVMGYVIRKTDVWRYKDMENRQLKDFVDKEIFNFSEDFEFYFKSGRGYSFDDVVDFIKKFACIKNVLTKDQLKSIQTIILSIGEKSLKNIIKRRVNKENHKHYIKDLISLLPKRLRDELVVYLI